MAGGRTNQPSSDRGGLAVAELRGVAARARWIRVELVVPGPQLAQALGIPQEALVQATARGELVGIEVGGRLHYPKALLSMDRSSVGAICRALGTLQDSEKLMFWLRDHGTLGGRNVAEAMEAGTPTAKVTRLAEAWARELIGADGPNGGDLVEGLECRS